jgi:hypothetical protein
MWNDRYLNPCSIYNRAAFEPMTIAATVTTVAGAAISAESTIMGGNAAADAGLEGGSTADRLASLRRGGGADFISREDRVRMIGKASRAVAANSTGAGT